MSLSIVIDWKTVLAVGASICGIGLVCKLDPSGAAQVSATLAETTKECAIAKLGNR